MTSNRALNPRDGANSSAIVDDDLPDHLRPRVTPLKDKLNQSFYDDDDSSEDEGMPDYKAGGYHPIHVGEVLMDRYIII